MRSIRFTLPRRLTNLIQSANAKSAVLASIDVNAAGDGVVKIRRATLNVHPEGGAATAIEVKYVVYWRQEDGLWKRHVEIWNRNSWPPDTTNWSGAVARMRPECLRVRESSAGRSYMDSPLFLRGPLCCYF
jgi:hypothetical protein